ncbi:putative lytic transglycosylase, catalytic [Escherichia coli]|uniref:Putative lytic transglycosylase, catalytic n=1 Tax=Escherichia coli TaxID=562 RepID=A0A377A324_ECOLX|nr:putative lytic transglycosylase, catalytic [Escherichia coli]
MSPIGLITALAAGIALLWEDYQTWKEGGDSLIDWGKWKPEVDAALKMVRDLKTTVNDLVKALAKLLNIDPKSWSLKWDFSNFIDQMGEFSKMLNMIADLLTLSKMAAGLMPSASANRYLIRAAKIRQRCRWLQTALTVLPTGLKSTGDSIPAVWAGRYAAGLVMMSRNNMHRLRNEENGITIRETLILLVRQGLLLNARAGDCQI